MSEQKPQPTAQTVEAFIGSIADEGRRQDCVALRDVMKDVTGCEPRMWGASIVGFGAHHYRYASGREGDTFLIGFSPRKGDLTLYGFAELELREVNLDRLGKHRSGKGCLYIKRVADVDAAVLRGLLSASVRQKTSAPEPT